MTACQEAGLGRAVEVLGIAPSSLSDRLKSVEGELGFKLFERARRGLVSNASAQWLFRESINILHAEALARRLLRGDAYAARLVTIEVRWRVVIVLARE